MRRILCVDHEHAVTAGLDRDIAADADKHVHIALRGQNVDLDIIQVLVLLRPRNANNTKENR